MTTHAELVASGLHECADDCKPARLTEPVRNEAAERLRETMIRNRAEGMPSYVAELDAALAAERRATVERSAVAIEAERDLWLRGSSEYLLLSRMAARVRAILDEEAAP